MPAVALADPESAEQAAAAWGGQVLAGEEGVRELILTSEARPGPERGRRRRRASGPTIVALTEGIDLALANKESLVIGGELVMALAEATDARIIPVDSEHSALYQLIGAEPPGTVERLVLTASGGPFRGRTDLSGITTEEALAHPTWEMGGRITIDSATLMNKGFEMIEAHHLFGVPYERIDVVVHPQSIVHSLVHLNDGASLAHLGYPDMKVPISYALQFPERADVEVPTLDLASVGELSFEPPDTGTFACLRLAREAGEVGGTAPCVLNATDEVAVEAFLAGADPVHRDPRGDRAHAGGPPSGAGQPLRGALRRRCGCARARAQPDRGPRGRMTWVLVVAGFAALIMLHEGGHFVVAKTHRHAGGALLPLLPAEARQHQARGDRVRDRDDPPRGLREDHRDEPGGARGGGARRRSRSAARSSHADGAAATRQGRLERDGAARQVARGGGHVARTCSSAPTTTSRSGSGSP